MFSDRLPWPEPRGLNPLPTALPSTSSRTTASAVPTSIAAGLPVEPITISSSMTSDISLMNHIQDNQLGLRERPCTPGDGNCWYWANCDLIQLHNLHAPTDPDELRKAVRNTLNNHPLKMHWIKQVFRGKNQKYNKFVKDQSKPNAFIDHHGIIVVATSDYLKVMYHLVGTSNTTKAPVTKLCDEEKSRTVFHVGYYQDTTDRNDRPLRAGHYQSLEVVPGVDVPCCSIVAEVPEMDNDLDGVKCEEKILGAFIEDRNMVKMSLQRLMNLKCVNLDTLFSTNISHILYNDLRPKYAASTLEGKLCRRLLKRYQSICINSPGFDQDDLPPITDVSEEESEESTNPRSFRSLFSGPRSYRASLLISEMGNIPEVVDDIRATDGLASSVYQWYQGYQG